MPARSFVRSLQAWHSERTGHPPAQPPPLRPSSSSPALRVAPRARSGPRASHTDLFGYGFALQKGPGPRRAVVTCLTKQSTGPLCPAMQKVSTVKAIWRGEAVVVREEWSGTTKSPPPVEFVTDEATTRCLPDPCVGVGCGVAACFPIFSSGSGNHTQACCSRARASRDVASQQARPIDLRSFVLDAKHNSKTTVENTPQI